MHVRSHERRPYASGMKYDLPTAPLRIYIMWQEDGRISCVDACKRDESWLSIYLDHKYAPWFRLQRFDQRLKKGLSLEADDGPMMYGEMTSKL